MSVGLQLAAMEGGLHKPWKERNNETYDLDPVPAAVTLATVDLSGFVKE